MTKERAYYIAHKVCVYLNNREQPNNQLKSWELCMSISELANSIEAACVTGNDSTLIQYYEVLSDELENVRDFPEQVKEVQELLTLLSETDIRKDVKMDRSMLYFEICNRAEKHGYNADRLSLMMDIESAAEKFNMRLQDWLAADDFNFLHDIHGIYHNIVRDTFPATDFGFFVPRFAGERSNKEE